MESDITEVSAQEFEMCERRHSQWKCRSKGILGFPQLSGTADV